MAGLALERCTFVASSSHSIAGCKRIIPKRPISGNQPSRTRSQTLRCSSAQMVGQQAISSTRVNGSTGSGLPFMKYQGLGNDFILVDNLSSPDPRVTPSEAAQLCDRHFGVGADGVIFLLPGQEGCDYTMRIFNSDGSEPEMCGNGIRCLAQFIAHVSGDDSPQTYSVHTLAGRMEVQRRSGGQVRVDMGPPTLSAPAIPTTLPSSRESQDNAVVAAPLQVAGIEWRVTCVSMGNPHCVTFSNDQFPQGFKISDIDLHAVGPHFESHPVFPARINTEFVEVVSPTELRMMVWERGAGPTLACGTGACALVVAAVLEGRAERSCLVHLPGGPLEIEWSSEDNHVYMTGPAQLVFGGQAVL